MTTPPTNPAPDPSEAGKKIAIEILADPIAKKGTMDSALAKVTQVARGIDSHVATQYAALLAERDELRRELEIRTRQRDYWMTERNVFKAQLDEIAAMMERFDAFSCKWRENLDWLDAQRVPCEPPGSKVRRYLAICCMTTLDLVRHGDDLTATRAQLAGTEALVRKLREALTRAVGAIGAGFRRDQNQHIKIMATEALDAHADDFLTAIAPTEKPAEGGQK